MKDPPKDHLQHPEWRCPICKQYRRQLGRHLLRVHGVKKDCKEIKGKEFLHTHSHYLEIKSIKHCLQDQYISLRKKNIL